MSRNNRGVSLTGYVVYLMVVWLGQGTSCVPLLDPREAGVYTALSDTNDTSTQTTSDTCWADCSPQDMNFVCSVHNETGWRQYRTRYQTSRFSITNASGPELVAVALDHRGYNGTGQTSLRPALSLTINISAEILGTPDTPPHNPGALLVRISGINDSYSVREDLYTDTPLYRLYSFTNYTPTTRDTNYPRQAFLKCIDSLDVYRLEITAFVHVPVIRFMTRTVYTITSPNYRDHYLPPVIATSLHPTNGNVIVVFETNEVVKVSTVALIRINEIKFAYSRNVPSKTSVVTFQNVTAGMYKATIEIADKQYHSHQFCVRMLGNMDDNECPRAPEAEPFTYRKPRYLMPALVFVLGLVLLCSVIAFVLYLNRYRLTSLIKQDHQFLQVKYVTRILLLNRSRDQQVAKYLVDFVEEHFPWVTFVSDEEHGADIDIQSNLSTATTSCDHVIVIWSPLQAEGDVFDKTITHETFFNCPDDVDLCVIFPSDGADSSLLPPEHKRARTFDLPTDIESFCQHCFSKSPLSLGCIQNFYDSASFKKLVESCKKDSCTEQVDIECDSRVENPANCLVLGVNERDNTKFNIEISEMETQREEFQSIHLEYTSCPIHGMHTLPQTYTLSRHNSEQNSFSDQHAYNEQLLPTPSSLERLESKFLLLNAGI
ncbi:uncharacterized protein LOC117330424 [Pecten maximus]|uniref:uncharacterized protein LOC117330424 n=1 Tax=Pecten maximus TaxID=6579 RepID=UPI001457EDE6|nr:uncharacterized protein LOC117330424 [Pecten maximus]